MESTSNKIIYDAQKFIKVLLQVTNMKNHSGNNLPSLHNFNDVSFMSIVGGCFVCSCSVDVNFDCLSHMCLDCFQWRCFDPKIAAWILDPDHPPENFYALLKSELGKNRFCGPEDNALEIKVKQHLRRTPPDSSASGT